MAADEYGRAHPDPGEDEGDAPSPGGVRRAPARRVRWAVSWRVAGAAALAIALVVGAVVLRTVAERPGAAVDLPEPVPLAESTAAASPSATPSPVVVVVDVVGAVPTPGVVRLPVGSRVLDAVTAAGGPAVDADLTRVNLARVLVDGEQVVVPRPGEPDPEPEAVASAGGGGPVDLNTASLAQLDSLPGVGPVLAQRIIDRRPFSSVDELDEVSGVGPTLLERLRPLVTT